MRDVIVIGAGRQGTTYFSQVLQEVGIDVGHEKIESQGIVSWSCTYDVHPALHGSSLKEALQVVKDPLYIHLIRDPRKAIPSMLTIDDFTWRWIADVPISNMRVDDPRLLKAMKYWYYWNVVAYHKADFSVKLNNIKRDWEKICYRIGNYKPFPSDSHFRRNERTHRKVDESEYEKYPELWKNINELWSVIK